MDTVFTGRVWKFGDRISTDFMYPGKIRTRPGITLEEAASYCMSANRPGWSKEVRPGDILVAGVNFGCGSSRNCSMILKALGIACVLAETISRIHLRNAVNTGLPTLLCPGITGMVEEGDELHVDIVTGMVKNLTRGSTVHAETWPEGSPPYDILMAGGLENFIRKKLAESQAR
jgi:3-isopropylmalate/(R)-2-methylmalate dehydratase small subunit